MKKMIAIMAALALLALACGEEEPVTPRSLLDLSSPDGVLQTVVFAFNHHSQPTSIVNYKAALSPDFIFYFNPTDVGDIVNGYQIPESWNYAEDTNATRNMFNEAYDISFSINQIDAPGADDAEFFAGNVSISLTVMTDGMNGYCADKGYCDFQFKKQTDGSWRLVRWWDVTHDLLGGGAPTSLGRIKAYFK